MIVGKFELEITDIQRVFMSSGATILSVANQRGKLCLWALIDPDLNDEERVIEIIGTGNPVNPETPREFIGTVAIDPFVWHVFEVGVG